MATIDALGNRSTTAYDNAGRSIASTNPLDETSTTVYDAAGRSVATIDALGNRSTTAYDNAGRSIASTNPLDETSTTVYDAAGRSVATIDPLGNRSTTAYDNAGRSITSTNPLDETSTTVYDAAGRSVATIDPLGNRSTTAYDNAGRSVASTNPLDETSTTVYDAAGRSIAAIDPLGNRSTTAYDNAGRSIASTNPLDETSTTVYDAAGRSVASIDPLGNRSTTAYDAAGRSIASTNPLDETSTTVYDAAGRSIAAIDPLGNLSTTAYDNAGQLIRTENALNQLTTLGYDAAGQQTIRIDARGNRTTYAYDAAGRIEYRKYPDGSRITWSYDNAGNPLVINQTDGRYTRTYDSLNRVKSVTNPDGTLTFSYDENGNQTLLIDIFSGRTTYAYDAASRVSHLINPEGDRTSFSYDSAGRRTQKNLANGTRASFTYDADSQLTALYNFKSDNTVISSFDYSYDPAGRRKSVTESNGDRVTWRYDTASQLTAEHRSGANAYSHTFTYDANGNRLIKETATERTTSTYNTANQLITSENTTGVTTYTYDASGNQLTTETPTNQVTTNTWSYENKLTQITEPTGDSTDYTFAIVQREGTEQRVSKDDGIEATRFIWDAKHLLLETTDVGVLVARYDYSPEEFGNLISQRQSFETNYHHFDGLGSTSDLTDAAEVITDDYSYEAFGEDVSTTGTTPNPHCWVGELGYYKDEESSLYSLQQRMYDPITGRFQSEDPIQADESNLYRYVGNNPVTDIDPNGEQQAGALGYIPYKQLEWGDFRSPAFKLQPCHYYLYLPGIDAQVDTWISLGNKQIRDLKDIKVEFSDSGCQDKEGAIDWAKTEREKIKLQKMILRTYNTNAKNDPFPRTKPVRAYFPKGELQDMSKDNGNLKHISVERSRGAVCPQYIAVTASFKSGNAGDKRLSKETVYGSVWAYTISANTKRRPGIIELGDALKKNKNIRGYWSVFINLRDPKAMQICASKPRLKGAEEVLMNFEKYLRRFKWAMSAAQKRILGNARSAQKRLVDVYKNLPTMLKRLLRHEQGHFDISELYARSLRAEMLSMRHSVVAPFPANEKDMEKIKKKARKELRKLAWKRVLYYNAGARALNVLYDSKNILYGTNHGIIDNVQRSWNSALDKRLKESSNDPTAYAPINI